MPLSARFVMQSTFGLLLVGFAALLVIVGTTFWLGQRAQVYFDEVIAARDIRASAVELRNAVQTAESSQRGFIVMGNQIYLAPYDTAKAQAERQLAALRRSLGSDPQSRNILQRLAVIVGEKFAEMDESIALKRARRDAEMLAVFRSNRGKALMDEANVFVAGIVRAADERLTAGVSEQHQNARWLRTVSIAGGLVILLVVGGAVISVYRYTSELRAARDEVNVLNTELERRVRDRTADLAAANDEIRRFAYIVSHDLRAPLINIMGFTSEIETVTQLVREALEEEAGAQARAAARQALAGDLPEAVGFIRSSTAKMDRLIGSILKLSREGRRTLRPETVNLGALADASIGAIRHQLDAADGAIDLVVDVDQVVSDRLSLEQILGNLLDNAVKYRAEERPLRIGLRIVAAPANRFVIEVADNGRGIAERDRERVFEIFSRLGPQTQPGEGIGLSYVRLLAKNLGGDVTLTSALGEGTTFRVTLPRTAISEPEKA